MGVSEMKMYKVKDIVEILTEMQMIGIEGYCGFEFNEKDNLVITLKDHEPDYPEAVEEIEILKDAGNY